jgi:hypothetical protein
MKLTSTIGYLLLILASTGCETAKRTSAKLFPPPDPNKPKPLRGPHGSWGHPVEVLTSTPGSKIEVNKEYIGDSPLTIVIYGERDGVFHRDMDYMIRAYPVKPGQTLQWKFFTGIEGGPRAERIPKKIYFDLNLERAPEKKELKVTTEDRTNK